MIRMSNISWRFLSVWRRNLIVYRKIWKVNFLVPLLEPAFYILAFGLGFQGLVQGSHLWRQGARPTPSSWPRP